MREVVIALALIAGCKYTPSEITPGGDDARPSGDGDVDGPPTTCATEGETACRDGRTQMTCGTDGAFDPALDKTCDFACMGTQCVAPSNLPIQIAATCPVAGTKRIKPAANATVTITGTGITCSPNCGDGSVLSIAPTATLTGSPSIAVYCLTELDLSLGIANITPGPIAVAFFVDGPVTIGVALQLDGESAPGGSQGGAGGIGGFAGGNRSSAAGNPGLGPCGGQGGEHTDVAGDQSGGGGGGGGYLTAGGNGGQGSDSLIVLGALGGVGGTACGNEPIIPLGGGSGGGSGGKGNCTNCGYAAGGGGGALQLTSRTSITIASTSTVLARGGNGDGGGDEGGGGGGGAGGALLFEAPVISVAGTLDVSGGTGGDSAAGLGGAGGGATPGAGASALLINEGGSGGGGAAGRIRINAPNASCVNATPMAACTTGLPPAAP